MTATRHPAPAPRSPAALCPPRGFCPGNRFAKAWQKRPGFAEPWQNPKTAPRGICQGLAKFEGFCQTLANCLRNADAAHAQRSAAKRRASGPCQPLANLAFKLSLSLFLFSLSLLLPSAARADGLETFDHTGLRTNGQWVAATNFDGTTEGVAWTAAQVRGHPQLRPGDPAIAIRSLDASNKGWIRSAPVTGGVARVTLEFAIASDSTNAVADFDVRVGDLVRNVRTNGPGIHAVSLDWLDARRRPVTNDCTIAVSNRLATSATVAIDNLAWQSPRLVVAIDPAALSLTAEGRPECTFDATVWNFTDAPVSSLAWTVSPEGFSGDILEGDASLTLLPAVADEGTAWTVSCTATAGTDTAAATAVLDLLDPRFLDFEDLPRFPYPTNFTFDAETGAIELLGLSTNLSGLPWRIFNARPETENAIGAQALRLRHSSLSTPALFESLEPFAGIGSVSFACANNHPTNWISFVLETRADESGEWTPAAPAVRLQGRTDIAANRLSFDIGDPADLYLRIRTTGGSGATFNLDDFTVTPPGGLIPVLRAEGAPAAAAGRPYALAFRLLNAEGAPREWTVRSVTPEGPVFTETADGLLLSFTPAEADIGTVFTATASVSVYAGQYECSDTFAFAVARAPAFDLATGNASPLPIGAILDIHMTNLVVDGRPVSSNSPLFDAEWSVAPPLEPAPTLKQYNRLRYGNAFAPADAGNHDFTLVVTDRSNTLSTARTLHFRLFDPDASPDPRFLGFEDFDLETAPETPATATLSGAPWQVASFRADWTASAPKNGTTAARLALPAAAGTLENLDPYPGIGYLSFHAAGEGARIAVSLREAGAGDWTPLPGIGPLSASLEPFRLYVGTTNDAFLSISLVPPADASPSDAFTLDDISIGPFVPPEAWELEGATTCPAGGGFDLLFTATGLDPGLPPDAFLALRDGWDVTADFVADHPRYALRTRDEPGGATSTLTLTLLFPDGHELTEAFTLSTGPGGAVVTAFDPAARTLEFNASPRQAYTLFAVTNLPDAFDPDAWIWSAPATGIGRTTLPLPDLPVPAAFFGLQTLP